MTTLSAEINGSLIPKGEEGEVPGGLDFPLAASASPLAGKGQYMTLDPSTGLASIADDSTPHQIAAGYVFPDELVTFDNSNAGNAVVRTSERYAIHTSPSTAAGDAFTAADVGTTWWFADSETPGKLSHTGTLAGANLKNRSLGGLVVGLVAKGRAAIRHWGGPIAQAIARGVHCANHFPGGSLAKAIDSGATVDIAETLLDGCANVHGPIAAVYFDVTGTTLAASGTTDYKTMNVYKRDGAGGGTTLVATVDTQTTAFTQWTTVAFTLSTVAGANALLETDILTFSQAHTGNGAVIPAGKLRVIRKAI